jgi:ankyrin repeat protein
MVNLLLLARNTLKVQSQDALDSALSMSSHKGYLNIAQHLIYTGARITQSVLNVTAWFGTTEMMQLLLRNGGKFALEDEDGLPNTVLHYGRASFEMKQLILEFEPRLVNVNNIGGMTPLDTLYLFDIKEPEDLQQQAFLLIEAGVEVSSSWALSHAASKGHVDVVRRLLALESKNLYINTRDLDGNTAILRACLIPENHTIAELLIQAGSDIELRKDDWPPLFFAVHAGATRNVQCLLQAGCNIHARGRDGKTALHLAATQGNLDIVQCLLQAGLDPCAKTERGKNPLHCCIEGGQTFWCTDGLAEVAALALLGSINLGFQGVDGPALDQNVVARVKVVLCLIQTGADVSSQDDLEHTPLDSLALLTRGVPESQRAIHHPRLSPWESMNRKAIGPTRQAQGALSGWMNTDLRAWAIPLPHDSENSKGDSGSDEDLPTLADIFGES